MALSGAEALASARNRAELLASAMAVRFFSRLGFAMA